MYLFSGEREELLSAEWAPLDELYLRVQPRTVKMAFSRSVYARGSAYLDGATQPAGLCGPGSGRQAAGGRIEAAGGSSGCSEIARHCVLLPPNESSREANPCLLLIGNAGGLSHGLSMDMADRGYTCSPYLSSITRTTLWPLGPADRFFGHYGIETAIIYVVCEKQRLLSIKVLGS
jgi:hypothetical protein